MVWNLKKSKFNEQFKAWLADVKTVHGDQGSSFLRLLVPSTERMPRIATVIRQLTPDINARCTDRRWSDQEIKRHISEVVYFLHQFDDIIRPYQHSETVEVERPLVPKERQTETFRRHLDSENYLGKRQPSSAASFRRSIGRITAVDC